jgi:hypothetical protein
MMPESPNPPPISSDELIKIKHNLEPGSFQRVEVPGAIVLVIRSRYDYPDIVNDIEVISDELELEDIEGLTDVCIVGDVEIIGIKLEVINIIMEKRMDEDAKIVEDLYNKLENAYDVLLFESEHDAHKKLRLGIRIPMDMKSLRGHNLPELLSKVKLPVRRAKVVYVIANDDYLRFFGKKFYQEVTDFVAEQTPRTIEEEKVIKTHVLGGMADHFVEDEEEDKTFQKKITEIEEEPPAAKPVKKPTKSKTKSKAKGKDSPSSTPKSSVKAPDSSSGKVDPVEAGKAIENLRSLLSIQGYTISEEVLEDIDIIANPGEVLGDYQRETQIFVKFIVNPSLRDMINFEKMIEKYEVKLGILVTPDPSSDAKIFTVGKNMSVVSPEDFEQEVSSI